jgi:uncharacterized membrane protein YeaQ/YmgE (transglycosylase-associated protein family)
MHLIGIIVIGFIVGAIAKFVMPGRDPGGFVITTLLGIGGAVVANYIGQAVGFYAPGEAAGFIASVLGAIGLLYVYRLMKGRPSV